MHACSWKTYQELVACFQRRLSDALDEAQQVTLPVRLVAHSQRAFRRLLINKGAVQRVEIRAGRRTSPGTRHVDDRDSWRGPTKVCGRNGITETKWVNASASSINVRTLPLRTGCTNLLVFLHLSDSPGGRLACKLRRILRRSCAYVLHAHDSAAHPPFLSAQLCNECFIMANGDHASPELLQRLGQRRQQRLVDVLSRL